MADFPYVVPPALISEIQPFDLLKASEEQVKAIVRPYFDVDYYRHRYHGAEPSADDLLDEFCGGVRGELRDPNQWFSSRHYIWIHTDVRESGVLPFLHYLVHGHRENRWIYPAWREAAGSSIYDEADPNRRDMAIIQEHFDEQFYRSHYPDMAGPQSFPLEHYCVFGWHERRDPNDWFSTLLYLRENPDVAEAQINPFVHYILYGQAEDRSAWPVRESQARRLRVDSSAQWVETPELSALIAQTPAPLDIIQAPFFAAKLNLHWVIPDFTIGSGGHMTIFRTIRHLEFNGHNCSIWVFNPRHHASAEECYDDIVKYFQPLRASVRFCDDGLWRATGDGLIATGWQTVSQVMRASGFKERFYFVQDHEPRFYATGSLSLAAELSYSEDLACICASPWLADLMRTRYGRWARPFWLAYDRADYYPSVELADDAADRPLRIALYGRNSTARRCVELALLALEHLAASGEAFEVHIFGADIQNETSRFPATVHGVMNAQDLGDLYRTCDIGVCFSATNYSLVPQEMMACGLPVVELDVPSTRMIFPPGVVTYAGPHPLRIAEAIRELLHDRERRLRQRNQALAWVGGFTWAGAAASVVEAMIERLRENGHSEAQSGSQKKKVRPRGQHALANHRPVRASVCIPTFNGGPLLHRVIERVRAQETPWPYEIIIIDSSSTDGSIERYQGCSDIRLKQIEQRDFGHGRTRNMCMEQATGEFCLFLTQDALPVDGNWIYNMVTCLEHFPEAAGAFGRHVPWPSASAFVRHEITEHFNGLGQFPVALSKATDPVRWASGDQGWRQILHFFSDNNSCLRRSCWEKIPFPDCVYGEDQLWANLAIENGYQKLYVPSAAVFHSHEYGPAERRSRAETEALFFESEFNYAIYDWTIEHHEQILRLNRTDRQWAKLNQIADAELAARLVENAARLDGHRAGSELARQLRASVVFQECMTASRGGTHVTDTLFAGNDELDDTILSLAEARMQRTGGTASSLDSVESGSRNSMRR